MAESEGTRITINVQGNVVTITCTVQSCAQPVRVLEVSQHWIAAVASYLNNNLNSFVGCPILTNTLWFFTLSMIEVYLHILQDNSTDTDDLCDVVQDEGSVPINDGYEVDDGGENETYDSDPINDGYEVDDGGETEAYDSDATTLDLHLGHLPSLMLVPVAKVLHHLKVSTRLIQIIAAHLLKASLAKNMVFLMSQLA